MVFVGHMGAGSTFGRTFTNDIDDFRMGLEYHAHFDIGEGKRKSEDDEE
jgi:hypothetical protein